ncbi:MAG: sensor histidine kinase [Mycoplasmatales bacterium]
MSKAVNDTVEILVKSLPTPIIMLDNNLRTTAVNSAFKNVFGQHGKIIRRGQKLKSILIGHEELYNELLSKIINKDVDSIFVHQIQNKSYEITTTLINKNDKRIFFTFLDVSQREELETSRRKFISNVAHELRTPLAAASSYAEILAFHDDLTADEIKEDARYIYSELQRLANLVNDLFDITRYDQNQITLKKTKFNINDLIKDIKALYKNKTNKNDFLLEYNSIDIQICADYDRLKQVMINLMDNAFSYSKDMISVNVEEKKNKVRISVVDNGPGLTLEQKEKIFNRFYRTDVSRARHSGGSGLGLAIVKEFISLHNGSIYVHSELDIGSEFIVEIPV